MRFVAPPPGLLPAHPVGGPVAQLRPAAAHAGQPGAGHHRQPARAALSHADAARASSSAFGINHTRAWSQQYFTYLGNTLTGNLGVSLPPSREPVGQVIADAHLPWTLGLVGITTILAFVLGTADRRDRRLAAGQPARQRPAAAVRLHHRDPVLLGRDDAHPGLQRPASAGCPSSSATRPAHDPLVHRRASSATCWSTRSCRRLTLLITTIGGWVLTMRNNMVTTLTEDYVRMARAKGLPSAPDHGRLRGPQRDPAEPDRLRHVARDSCVSGAILVEYVFNYPGRRLSCCSRPSRTTTIRSCRGCSCSSPWRCCVAILLVRHRHGHPRPAHQDERASHGRMRTPREPAARRRPVGQPSCPTRRRYPARGCRSPGRLAPGRLVARRSAATARPPSA